MEKTKEVGEYKSFEVIVFHPLHEIIKWLTDSKELGATHIKLGGIAWDRYVDEVTGQPYIIRPETDEEKRDREEAMALRKAMEDASREDSERQ
jgi:hypothetical protein